MTQTLQATAGRLLDASLEDDLGLRDHEVDRIKARAAAYVEGNRVQQDVARAGRAMDAFLAGLSIFSFCFLVLFCFTVTGALPFLLFYIVLQALVIGFWRLVISPARFHRFGDDALFITYRASLDQLPRFKASLRDEKYKFLLFAYLLLDAMVICAILDAGRLLPYLNNIIFDRGEFPASTLSSLVPGIVIIGLAVNVFGGIVAARYKIVDPVSGNAFPAPRQARAISVVVLASIIALVVFGSLVPADFAAYVKPSPTSDNFLAYLDMDLPMFRARFVVTVYFGLVFAGGAVLAFLIVVGFTALESALVRHRVTRHWSLAPPAERNWEFAATVARHEQATRDKIAARKRAIAEIGIMCLLMVIGMWFFLKLGGEIWGLDWMNYAGYATLGLALIWFMFISPFHHARKDGKFHYPTAKQNGAYAWIDERGMGSFKHYYREVFGKKKGLILWVLYWMLMLVSVFNFDEIGLAMMNWKAMFANPARPPEGVIVDFVGLVVDAPEATAMAVVLVATGLSVVAFVAALGKPEADFNGSKAWCMFYKGLVGAVMIGCFFWAFKVPPVAAAVNLMSVEFLLVLGLVIALFGVAAVLCLLVIIPFLVKFDNLGAPKKEIVLIILSTIVLTWIIVLVFDFFLPMTDVNGDPIVYGYPFRFGGEYEVSALLERFDLGEFLMEWFGRYVAWGAVQQYLFMSYFLVLWRKAFPRSKGYIVAVGTACIFGVIHAIDWPLMAFTGIAGMMWAWYWNKEYYDQATGRVVRGNNLLLWGLVHGFGGSLLGMIMPFSLAVGPFNM